jgi:hypothetical protein
VQVHGESLLQEAGRESETESESANPAGYIGVLTADGVQPFATGPGYERRTKFNSE